MIREEAPAILVTDGLGAPADGAAATAIQGGRDRGLILHKLIEEVLTGETAESPADLRGRAEVLIRALDRPVMDDPSRGSRAARARRLCGSCTLLPEVRVPQAEAGAGVWRCMRQPIWAFTKRRRPESSMPSPSTRTASRRW